MALTLIVEDGTGISDANSYVTIQEVTDYLELVGDKDSWVAMDEQEQIKTIILSTSFLDSEPRWVSSILTNTQSLEFPRIPFTDTNGRLVEGVPELIKKTVSIIINATMNGEDLSNETVYLKSESFGNSLDSYAIPLAVNSSPEVNKSLKILRRYGYINSSIVHEVFRA